MWTETTRIIEFDIKSILIQPNQQDFNPSPETPSQ